MLACLGGCSSLLSYPERIFAARRAFASFAFDAAAESLKEGASSGGDQLCCLLERGIVLHTAGKYPAATKDSLEADAVVHYYESKAVISASDTASSVAGLLVNDRLLPYRGAGFEKILLHTHLALDFLMERDLAAEIDFPGGARRGAVRAQWDRCGGGEESGGA